MTLHRLLAAVTLALELSACVAPPESIPPTSTLAPSATPEPPAPSEPAETAPTPEPPTPVPVTPVSAPGPCEHLLWPLVDGASWTYRLATPEGEQTVELTASVGDVGATLTADGESRQLICGEGALAGLPPLPVAHPALGTGLTGSNPRGDLLPAPGTLLPLGQPAGWDIELDAGGTITLPGEEGSATLPVTGGRLVLIHETGELETVSTPVGDLLALPVNRDALFDLEVAAADGSTRSVIVSASLRLHYAEGVGLVRAEYRGGMVSSEDGALLLDPGSVLELTAYSVPR